MAFTTWQSILDEWKTALADRDMESFFISASENRVEMRTTYTKLGNITAFTGWLEGKAADEAVSTNDGKGGILFSVGGS